MGLLDLTAVEMNVHFACLPGGKKSVPQVQTRGRICGESEVSHPRDSVYLYI